MNTKSFITAGLFLVTTSFVFTGISMANEKYDVRAFGPEKPIVFDTPVQVTFDHKYHTDDAGLACADCHGEIFAMQRGVAQASKNLTMAALAQGKYCGACHDGDNAFASDSECAKCHIPPEEIIVWTKPVEAVVFHHKTHTDDYGLDCDSCHDQAFVMSTGAAEESPFFTMKSLYDGKYCGVCHDGDTAFASNTLCNSCHIGKKGYSRMMGKDSHTQEASHGGH